MKRIRAKIAQDGLPARPLSEAQKARIERLIREEKSQRHPMRVTG
jgi:hypothetical protein